MPHNQNSFHGLGIAPKLLEILARNRYTVPTPIQQQCIPFAIDQKDVIGIAQTGTGKTLAFGIPIVQALAQKEGKSLIIVPTRELAIQVASALEKIASPMGLKTAVLIGGEAMSLQLKRLRLNPQVLIATPGRLIDHLEHRTVDLHPTRILVLDEADRMLDMGFLPQIKMVLNRLPEQRQTMIFSATMPPEIVSVATHYMKLPVRIEIAPPGTAPTEVSQELFFVESRDKTSLLLNLLDETHGSVLVFTRTKIGAKRLARQIRNNSKHAATELHSDRSQAQRHEAMNGFRVGRYRVLVATDIAARGIDVTGIELVVNYDLPATGEDYVHRIGRTGRAGAVGHAISFAMPHQRADVKAIEQVIRSAVRISPVPAFDRPDRNTKPKPQFYERTKSHKSNDDFWKSRSHKRR
ncbi:MAG TPA: DEAD/DEAH box helicase [Acidobacteriota bacterium]|nr:DEAD/DEAH box helicase [Acidobacteriota bacterium]